MTAFGRTFFDTAIGACGIAWGPRGIVGLQLPESDAAAGEARLARRFPDAAPATPPPGVQKAIDAIVALTNGEARDLGFVELDMSAVPAFERRVCEAAREIGPGATTTYGALAKAVGEPGGARAVGRAMGRNPFPIVVPCHRVLAADGKTGGFSAHGGVTAKLKLLTIERARTSDAPGLFDDLPLAAKPESG